MVDVVVADSAAPVPSLAAAAAGSPTNVGDSADIVADDVTVDAGWTPASAPVTDVSRPPPTDPDCVEPGFDDPTGVTTGCGGGRRIDDGENGTKENGKMVF